MESTTLWYVTSLQITLTFQMKPQFYTIISQSSSVNLRIKYLLALAVYWTSSWKIDISTNVLSITTPYYLTIAWTLCTSLQLGKQLNQ